MSGSFSARTRYKIAQDGAIIIRRTLLVGEAHLYDQVTALADEYVEAWTPFARSVMDAVAFAIDENGSPTHWYQAGNNLPSYPFLDVSTTEGYAIAMNNATPFLAPAVGLVFGKKSPCYHQDNTCIQEGQYVLNLMEWDTGVGILPGLTLPDVQTGDLLDSYIVLLPSHGLDAQLHTNLTDWAERIPAPRLIRADANVDETLLKTIEILGAFQGTLGQRVEHLAPLVVE
jgi:hypothetical protein